MSWSTRLRRGARDKCGSTQNAPKECPRKALGGIRTKSHNKAIVRFDVEFSWALLGPLESVLISKGGVEKGSERAQGLPGWARSGPRETSERGRLRR
eukprot:4679372-Pyramimonas_sp.AAC.1